jgi:muconolactone D-isomerase
MLSCLPMRGKIEAKITLEGLWKKEVSEAAHALPPTNPVKLNGIWKVVSQRRVIAIVDTPTGDDMDRATFGMPLAEYLELEHVWPLREYGSFIEDCKKGFKM